MSHWRTVARAQTVRCPQPVNFDEADEKLFVDAYENHLPESTLQFMTDVEAFGRGPLHHHGKLMKEFFALPEQADEWYRRRKHLRLAAEKFFQRRSVIDAPVIWITDNWSCGYFHWKCDALMRLQAASEEIDLSNVTLLLPYKYQFQPYLMQSLDPFKVGKIRFLRRFERAECSRFWFPSQVCRTGNFKREIVSNVRRQLVLRFSDN